MPPVARFEDKSAFLFTDFGMEFASRYFTAEEIATLGVYGPRSKHAGKPKGIVVWRKCTQGGWVYADQSVERRVGKVLSVSLATAEWQQQPVVKMTADRTLKVRAADDMIWGWKIAFENVHNVASGLDLFFASLRQKAKLAAVWEVAASLDTFFALLALSQWKAREAWDDEEEAA